jgi:putative transport protein
VSRIVDFLAEQPLLLLFVVAGLGQLVGSIRIAGVSLGVAGVLFAGIAIGAIDPKLALPELFLQLGLALFVYALGLASGPAFVASLRTTGLRRVFTVGLLVLAGAVEVVIVAKLMGLSGPKGAGLFTGVLTNTPALAGIVETLNRDPSLGDPADPVVAYSLAYPASVIASLVVVIALRKVLRRHPELSRAEEVDEADLRLVSRVIRVTRSIAVSEFDAATAGEVLVGRIERNGEQHVAEPTSSLEPGDLVGLIGPAAMVERVTPLVGERTTGRLLQDRSELDIRRIFVSDRRLAGLHIRELDLPARYGALVTRVRRGDLDLVGHPDLVLELGDRVRVLAPPDRMPQLTRFFGDSYRALGEVDVVGFSVGLALGLLLGAVPLPLPGGSSFTLGFAGGPLIAGLLLGTLRRTGPISWQVPYTAGLTLRQFGLVLFFAAIGTRAGQKFADTAGSVEGIRIVGVAFLLSLALAVLTMVIGIRALRMPYWRASGFLGGVFTQPATLAFATAQSRSEEPEDSYALAAPFAILLKIVLAQLVLVLV